MALPLGTALTYSMAPAAAGFAAGLILALPMWRHVRTTPEVKGKALVLLAVTETGLLFAFVAAFLASQRSQGELLQWPLVFLGAAAALQALVQGIVLRTGFGPAVADPKAFSRLLLRTVAPEALSLVAFLWFVMRAAALAP